MGRGQRRALGKLAEQVKAQVKAEMARRDMPLTTGLDTVLGSHNYAFQRLKGRIALDLNDVERIARHFGMAPEDLIDRAVSERASLTAGDGSRALDQDHETAPPRKSEPKRRVKHSGYVRLPEHAEKKADAHAAEVAEAERVKNRRRSGC